MTDPSLRDQLPQSDSRSAVGAEIAHLHDLLAAEERRAKRLLRWTLAVWAVVFAMMALAVLGLVLPMVAAQQSRAAAVQAQQRQAEEFRANSREKGGGQPAVIDTTQPASVRPSRTGASGASGGSAVAGVIAAFLLAAAVPLFVLLVLVGIVLLALLVLARRTASMNQVRVALASIDAQLRMLALAQKPPDAKA